MTFSASSIPRALRCLGSLVLEQTEYTTAYSEEGEDNHAEMEAAADVGDLDALPSIVREHISEGDELITETSFAYDVATDTGRKLGGPRAYADLRPFEIPGTPDLAIRGKRLVVVDYKNYEEVIDTSQLETYALTLARVFGYDDATIVVVYLGGLIRPLVQYLSAFDLDAHAMRLRKLHTDVAEARHHVRDGILPALVVGKHCKYCAAFTGPRGVTCPAQAQLAKAADTVIPMTVETMIPFQSDEDAAAAFDLLDRITALTKRMRAALYARAAERPIPLADGRMLGAVQKEGNRKIDADAAYELIRSRYGQAVADKSMQRKVVQKQIVEALKSAGVRGAEAAKNDIVKTLEAQGAVKRDTKNVVEIYEPQKLLKVVS